MPVTVASQEARRASRGSKEMDTQKWEFATEEGATIKLAFDVASEAAAQILISESVDAGETSVAGNQLAEQSLEPAAVAHV